MAAKTKAAAAAAETPEDVVVEVVPARPAPLQITRAEIDDVTDVANRLDIARTKLSDALREVNQILAETDLRRRTERGQEFLSRV